MNTTKVTQRTRYDTQKRSALTVQNTSEGSKASANIKDELRPKLIIASKSTQGW